MSFQTQIKDLTYQDSNLPFDGFILWVITVESAMNKE
tara:strand:- start:417 stop:527 length:111 start_codon:yes stop_codon:yes gene_type:complete